MSRVRDAACRVSTCGVRCSQTSLPQKGFFDCGRGATSPQNDDFLESIVLKGSLAPLGIASAEQEPLHPGVDVLALRERHAQVLVGIDGRIEDADFVVKVRA